MQVNSKYKNSVVMEPLFSCGSGWCITVAWAEIATVEKGAPGWGTALEGWESGSAKITLAPASEPGHWDSAACLPSKHNNNDICGLLGSQ